MRQLPRFAVGTIQPGVGREPATWAFVAALAEAGASPAVFRSSLAITARDPAQAIVRRASRHLDSWAMSRSDAIAAMARGASQRDTAIVEGTFVSDRSASQEVTSQQISSLDRLCQWLDLPRIAIVDVRELARTGLALRPKRL